MKKLINQDTTKINPDNIKELYNKVDQGDGIVTYWIEDSKAGLIALRKIVDQYWGFNANPWDIINRRGTLPSISQQTFQNMSNEQKQQLGLYLDKYLNSAQFLWENYNKEVPKRIAFKDGELYACSYSNTDKYPKKIYWRDKTGKGSIYFPKTKIEDKDPYIKEYVNKLKNIKFNKLSNEQLDNIINRNNTNELENLISNHRMPLEFYYKIIDKNNPKLLKILAQNNYLPTEFINKIKLKILENCDSKIAKILATNFQMVNDVSLFPRGYISQYEFQDDFNNLMIRLAEYEDPEVRAAFVWHLDAAHNLIRNSKKIAFDLINKLSDDEDYRVRKEIAKLKNNISPEIIQKLSKDKDYHVRKEIAGKYHLTPEIIENLKNDENEQVRKTLIKTQEEINKFKK